MSSGARVKKGKYTDADVLAIYMKYRESNIGPFTREVGDFIAHSERDRGATLDRTAYVFAQVAFFQTYQGTNKIPLNPTGKCGWWLRHYLLMKTKEASEAEIKQAAGITRKQATNAIKSWFPDKSAYPTNIKCNDPQIFLQLANHFCQILDGTAVFHLDQVRAELRKIFATEGIDYGEMDRFIVGTATVLHGRAVEIVPGFIAHVAAQVTKRRHIRIDHPDNNELMYWSHTLPDGDLSIGVHTENNTGDGLVPVALSFLDTNVDTEAYFCRSLVELDQYKQARLRLSGSLTFDTTRDLPVTGV